MANFDKFSRGACGHMLKHYERAKDENGEYVQFGNRDIDPERSHLNYNLGPEREGAQYTFIKQRCGEVYCLNRSNVNVLGSWIVTAPEGMPDDQLRPFFQASYDALEKKYSRENVVSAHVHMDESGRPHMHFAFVPVMYDKDKERYTVCAKKLITKTELMKFHPWLEAEVSQRLGYQVQLMNEATKDGNKTVTELKRERELAKQTEFAQQTEAAKAAAVKASQEAAQIEARKAELQEGLNTLETPEAVRQVEGKPTLFGGAVKVPKEGWELVKQWADKGAAAVSYGDNMRDVNEQLRQTVERLKPYDPKRIQNVLKAQEEELERRAMAKKVKELEVREAEMKAREQHYAAMQQCLREDLNARLESYYALQDRRKEAWAHRSEAERNVKVLEALRDDGNLLEGIFARVALLGARREAADAREKHERICAAVKAEKHKIREQQAELMEQKAEFDKTLQDGVKRAVQPQKDVTREQEAR